MYEMFLREGVIFNPKIYIADYIKGFVGRFPKKITI